MEELNSQDENYVSKTQRKKQAKEVEQVAEQLVAMTASQIQAFALPDTIARELKLARATEGRSSQRRQIKHLAGVLRKNEEVFDGIVQQLNAVDQVARQDRKQFHQIEDLRDRLCQEATFPEACKDLQELLPRINMKIISRLARSVHEHDDRRAYRDIFKRIKQEVESSNPE